MIDEDQLRELFAQAADSAPPPGGLPEGLFDSIAADRTADVPHPAIATLRQPGRLLAAAAAVILVVAIGAAFLGGGDTGSDDAATSAADMAAPSEESGTPPSTTIARGLGAPAADAGGGSGSDEATALADSAQVVKTGSMTLEVDEGAYDQSVDLLTTKVAGMGGYVAESSTSRSDERPAGALVLRVPAAQFDTLMADLRRLGKVVAEDSKGVDVGGQVADIDARLNALRATRDKLTAILGDAGSIDETLMVQDRITGVQTQIEQLEGQQRVLADQVAMSSVTVSLGEPGAERVRLDDDERDLGGAWDDARHRFGNGIENLVAWSGTAALLLLVVAALGFAVRLAWPRLQRMLL